MVNLLLYKPNNNLKNFFGPTRPGNTPFGHAFIFGRILTLEILQFAFFSMMEYFYSPRRAKVTHKCRNCHLLIKVSTLCDFRKCEKRCVQHARR